MKTEDAVASYRYQEDVEAGERALRALRFRGRPSIIRARTPEELLGSYADLNSPEFKRLADDVTDPDLRQSYLSRQ